MNNEAKQPRINTDRHEISCRVTNSMIQYAREQSKDIEALIKGLPYNQVYLTDTNNWVSRELQLEMCQRLREMFDDDEVMYKVGASSERLHSIGFLDYLGRLIGDPQFLIEQAPKLNKYFNKIDEIEIVSCSSSNAVVRYHAKPGYVMSADDCHYTRGLFAALPTIWGNKPAKIWEETCSVPKGKAGGGAKYCLYHISWLPRKFSLGRFFYNLFTKPKVLRATLEEIEKENDLIQEKCEELHEKNLQLQSHYVDTISTLIRAIDAKDHYTEHHSLNVSSISEDIAREIGLEDSHVDIIQQACKLHDLGKIGIRDNILLKPGKLTEEEWEEIKKHPVLGAEIIRPLIFLSDVALMIRQDHERWDGKGYPDGLKGDEIVLGARIIALADAYDAMVSGRPYAKAKTKAEAIEEIKKNSGTQFDPAVVEVFLKAIK